MMTTAGQPSLYLRWTGALILTSFGWLAILLELAPLNESAGDLPSPDILFCVVAFMVMRRPGGAPGVLILTLGLARDLLSGGPVGLGALTLLAAAETMRYLAEPLRRSSRIYEFATIAALTTAVTLAHIIVLTLVFAALPPLDVLALRLVMTVGTYFLVFFFFRQILRIRAERLYDRRLGRLAR
jgi:rod shape-determining protein MreD